jgi:RNA polymerase sigma factor (sigma-70 family)
VTMDIPNFQRLMREVLTGSDAARREVIETYGPHILRIVRCRLHMPLRRQFDSLDFAQSVWASFFAAPAERLAVRSPEELANYLAKIATNKVADAFRHRVDAQKNDIRRDQSLELLHNGAKEAVDPRQPSPSQIALADDDWENALKHFNAHARSVLTLIRCGYSYKEVSSITGFHPKAIQRLVKQLKVRLPQ